MDFTSGQSDNTTMGLNRNWVTLPNLAASSKEGEDSPSFTMVSYNILADKAIHLNINYKYVPQDVLFMSNRHHRLMQEIIRLKADIVCLQEVQEAHFHEVCMSNQVLTIFLSTLFRDHYTFRPYLKCNLLDGQVSVFCKSFRNIQTGFRRFTNTLTRLSEIRM